MTQSAGEQFLVALQLVPVGWKRNQTFHWCWRYVGISVECVNSTQHPPHHPATLPASHFAAGPATIWGCQLLPCYSLA